MDPLAYHLNSFRFAFDSIRRLWSLFFYVFFSRFFRVFFWVVFLPFTGLFLPSFSGLSIPSVTGFLPLLLDAILPLDRRLGWVGYIFLHPPPPNFSINGWVGLSPFVPSTSTEVSNRKL